MPRPGPRTTAKYSDRFKATAVRLRYGELVAHWEEGQRPDPGVYEIMNTEIRRCDIVNNSLIVFEFENGIAMHLEDNTTGSNPGLESIALSRAIMIPVSKARASLLP